MPSSVATGLRVSPKASGYSRPALYPDSVEAHQSPEFASGLRLDVFVPETWPTWPPCRRVCSRCSVQPNTAPDPAPTPTRIDDCRVTRIAFSGSDLPNRMG
jgi:hypothetical protein